MKDIFQKELIPFNFPDNIAESKIHVNIYCAILWDKIFTSKTTNNLNCYYTCKIKL